MRAEGYIDVVFAVNLAMDFFLLSAAGAVLRVRRKAWRRVLGAAAAAGVYCALAFGLPYPGMWSVPLGAGVLALGLAAAYCPVAPGLFAQLMAAVYVLAFAAGGVMNALAALSGPARAGTTLSVLSGGTAVSYIFLQLVRRHLRRNELQRQAHCAAIVRLNGREAVCRALVDTGNTLCEPITGAPVLVAAFSAVQACLPAPVARLFRDAREDDLPALLEAFRAGGLEARIRMIPFTSVGAADGMLVAFRSDEALFTPERGGRIAVPGAVVAVSRVPLGGEYNAILNPAMLGQSDKEA